MNEFQYAQPPEEAVTARWLARIEIAQFALRAVGPLINEDWGDGGHIRWDLAQRNTDTETLKSEVVFEEEILRGLRSCLPGNTTRDVVPHINSILIPVQELSENQSERMKQIGALAAQTGLIRCGILSESSLGYLVDDGAYSALAFHRGKITCPYDRLLYEHELGIKRKLERCRIEPRQMSRSTAGEPVPVMSVYEFIIRKNMQSTEGLGSGLTHANWWSELQLDFARIDQKASGNS